MSKILVTLDPKTDQYGAFVGLDAQFGREDGQALTDLDYLAVESFALAYLTGQDVAACTLVNTDGTEIEVL
jgi:hypothetical protein